MKERVKAAKIPSLYFPLYVLTYWDSILCRVERGMCV